MFSMSREIGIDAGHRVPTHGSKCKNLHGHRYKIIATCAAEELVAQGEQTAMVVDFGFLKEEMMIIIDDFCDHAMILWVNDPILPILLQQPSAQNHYKAWVAEDGYASFTGEVDTIAGKLYIVPFIPTAEALAKHWYERLQIRVHMRSSGHAKLTRIDVWETPNCVGTYIPNKDEEPFVGGFK